MSGLLIRYVVVGILTLAPGFVFAQATQTATTLNTQGSQLILQGKPAEALVRFEAAAKLTPDDPSIRYNIGLALFRLGRYRDALAPLELSLSHPASAQPARYMRGIVFFQLNDFEACASELEHVRANPSYAEQSLYMLVESYLKAGDARGSQLAFVELEQRYPDSAFLHKLMGAAYEARDYEAKALEEFQAALRVQPRMPDVAFAIGYIYLQQQKHTEARTWMNKELALQPCYARAHHYLAEMDQAEEQWDRAAAGYSRAIECDADLADSYIGLGTVRERQGRLEEAVKAYREAVRLQPNDSQGHFKLGTALRRTGKTEESNQELAIAKRLYNADREREAESRKKGVSR